MKGNFYGRICSATKIIGNSFAHVYINIELEAAARKMDVINYGSKWVHNC